MTQTAPPALPSLDERFKRPLARVRLLLRRLIIQRAAWLSEVRDGRVGDELVRFLMDREPDASLSDAVAVLDGELGSAAEATVSEDDLVARFDVLAERTGLNQDERDYLWLLLAPELDRAFLAVYRLLWGDARQRYCDEDFLAVTLAPRRPGLHVDLLGGRGALHRLGLVHRVHTDDARSTVHRLDPSVVSFLTGRPSGPEALGHHLILHPASSPEAWDGFDCAAVTGLAEHALPRCGVIHGPLRSGVVVALRQRLAASSRPLLEVDLEPTLAAGRDAELFADDARLLRAILREARLNGAGLFVTGLHGFDALEPGHARMFAELVRDEPGPVLLHCSGDLPATVTRWMLPVLTPRWITVEAPSGDARRAMWRHLLAGPDAAPGDDALEHLVRRVAVYPLTPEAMASARDAHRLTGEPIEDVCQRLVTHRMTDLAVRVKVDLGWGDVILPDQVHAQIGAIRTMGQHYDRIMDAWGLGRITTGRGMKVLFSGPSGTGKTLISGLLARDLGRELYRIDLSSVVSKYIGETEKHLTRLFAEASDAGVALLFDEADSLFAKRTTRVGSSVDKYANQSVNHLLQLVEAYDGLLVLTTNLEEAFDNAFARRLHFHVKFVRPEAEERERLWRVHLPSTLPMSDDVALDDLADRYDLSGGEIRKAVLRAAVSAIEHGRDAVGHEDLEEAARAEYVSQGRLPPSRSAF